MKEIIPYTPELIEYFGSTLPLTHRALPAALPLLPLVGKLSLALKETQSQIKARAARVKVDKLPASTSSSTIDTSSFVKTNKEKEPTSDTDRAAHCFEPTTFKKPTYCNTCNGFLWGLYLQGLQCKCLYFGLLRSYINRLLLDSASKMS